MKRFQPDFGRMESRLAVSTRSPDPLLMSDEGVDERYEVCSKVNDDEKDKEPLFRLVAFKIQSSN